MNTAVASGLIAYVLLVSTCLASTWNECKATYKVMAEVSLEGKGEECDCNFPFEYHGDTYTSCTNATQNGGFEYPHFWCSCLPGEYLTHKRWGVCGGCTDELEGCVALTQENGQILADTECVFPFIYKGLSYSNCTETDYLGRPWCSTTGNMDTANKWALCGKFYCDDTVGCKTGDGADYTGKMAITRPGVYGKACLEWSSISDTIVAGLTSTYKLEQSNNCRNPNGLRGPYCFTSTTAWSYCGVPDCKE